MICGDRNRPDGQSCVADAALSPSFKEVFVNLDYVVGLFHLDTDAVSDL